VDESRQGRPTNNQGLVFEAGGHLRYEWLHLVTKIGKALMLHVLKPWLY